MELDAPTWLVRLVRFSASGANRQPLRFILRCDAPTNARILPCRGWRGYLTAWKGPAAGERPSVYIIILGDTEIREAGHVDHGIAAQSIMLGATASGLGGWLIGPIHCERLACAHPPPKAAGVSLQRPRRQRTSEPSAACRCDYS